MVADTAPLLAILKSEPAALRLIDALVVADEIRVSANASRRTRLHSIGQ